MIEVLYVTTKLGFGGVQTFFYNFAPILKKNGVRLSFAVQTSTPQPFDAFIQELGSRIFVVTPLAESKYKFMRDIYKILIKNKEITIVHSHQNFNNIFSLVAAKSAQVKIRISHSHSNYISSSRLKEIAKTLLKIMLPIYATDYWACSKASAEWLFGKYASDERCLIVPNAIDVERFKFKKEIRNKKRKELGLTNQLVWIHSGSFSVVKNHVFLLELFSRYLNLNQNSILVLCGDGELRSDIECRVRELHLENNVILLGLVNNIEEYFCAADLLVFPSLFEGFPLTLIEAQSSGIPCVVSNAVTQDALYAVNAIQVASFEISDWLEAIQRVFKVQNIRENGYNCISKAGFNISEQAERLANIYCKLIGREKK